MPRGCAPSRSIRSIGEKEPRLAAQGSSSSSRTDPRRSGERSKSAPTPNEGAIPSDAPQTPTSPYGQQLESPPLAVRSRDSPEVGNVWTTLLNLWRTLLKL